MHQRYYVEYHWINPIIVVEIRSALIQCLMLIFWSVARNSIQRCRKYGRIQLNNIVFQHPWFIVWCKTVHQSATKLVILRTFLEFTIRVLSQVVHAGNNHTNFCTSSVTPGNGTTRKYVVYGIVSVVASMIVGPSSLDVVTQRREVYNVVYYCFC